MVRDGRIGIAVHCDVDDANSGAGNLGEDVDCRAASEEVRDHLCGHFRGIGGDTVAGDSVIAGEDDDARPGESMWGTNTLAG
ncbi:hypothetical protein GCM10020255_088990 [Rhodococcus baikonurensis]